MSTPYRLDLCVACAGHAESPRTSSAKLETNPEAREADTRMFLYLRPDTQTTTSLKQNHTDRGHSW